MNFWNHIERFILRNRLLIIFALVIYAGFMGYQTQYVKIAYRFVKVLPETDSASIDFDRVNEEFGNSSNGVIVAIETGENGEFFKPSHLTSWKNLIDSLESIEGINSAFSIT